MNLSTPRRYWDSGAVIAYLSDEKDAADGCALTLAAMERGELQLVVSMITIAEVWSLRNDSQSAEENAARVDRFFQRRDILPIQVDRLVAETAQRLQRRYSVLRRTRGLTADALHIASAIHAGATHLETTDGAMRGLSGKIEEAPGLVICLPGFGLQSELQLGDGCAKE